MVLAKADLGIAKLYSELAGDLHDDFFPIIEKEFELTRDLVLEYSDHEALLEGDITLQRAIMLRNPYVDPMSLMQIDLLKRWRASSREERGIVRRAACQHQRHCPGPTKHGLNIWLPVTGDQTFRKRLVSGTKC